MAKKANGKPSKGEHLLTLPMGRLKEISELPESEREEALRKLVREAMEFKGEDN